MTDHTPPSPQQTNALERVNLPGLFLVIAGVLNLFVALVGLTSSINTARMSDEELAAEANRQWEMMKPEWRETLAHVLQKPNFGPKDLAEGARQLVPRMAGLSGVWALFAFLAILGGLRMRRLRSHGLALTGASLVSIPFVSPLGCCLVGEVVGIWCLVVLLSNDVRAAFAETASAPPSPPPQGSPGGVQGPPA
jgi:hypothetical protein